jgi:phosphoglycolate phosphatase-like HAD superfamily hydrolase
MFRNIIWDVDGTLFDTYPAITKAIKAALNDLGTDAPLAQITALTKQSLNHCSTVLADMSHLDKDKLEHTIEKHFDRITFEENPPFPGVAELCQYICSIGGKNVIVTHRGRKGTQGLLTTHKLDEYFSGHITRDDGYPRKPDPAAFEAALATYHLEREETLTIGDRDIDILAGQAAGLFSCYYGNETDGIQADLVISNFGELYQYLVKAK